MSAGSGSLPRYIGQRVVLVIPMIWVLLTLVFLLLRVAPGDPVTAMVGGKLDPAAIALRRHSLGLD
ncbi:MAG: ABC transporter permease, partial [Nocardioidaceae bacterium]